MGGKRGRFVWPGGGLVFACFFCFQCMGVHICICMCTSRVDDPCAQTYIYIPTYIFHPPSDNPAPRANGTLTHVLSSSPLSRPFSLQRFSSPSIVHAGWRVCSGILDPLSRSLSLGVEGRGAAREGGGILPRFRWVFVSLRIGFVKEGN